MKVMQLFIYGFFLLFVFNQSIAQNEHNSTTDTINVQLDHPEHFSYLQTKHTNQHLLYDTTKISKSDAFVIAILLEKFGIWSNKVRHVNAIYGIKKNDVHTIALFVAAKALSNPAAEGSIKDILEELKSVYNEREYQFRLVSTDSTQAFHEKSIKLK